MDYEDICSDLLERVKSLEIELKEINDELLKHIGGADA